ncbi:MAG: NUDIX hydrolase [Candidatus Jorgensenbacteria bacterium]|nr:NUDIX hydrolase [Candidatus Jorgensenbacteria bacterium]
MIEVIPHSGVLTMEHASFLIWDKGEVESEILLVTKKKAPGVWGMPGGQSKPGESPLTTMYRETIEEIGFTLENPMEIVRCLVEDPSPHLFIAFAGYNGTPNPMEKIRIGPEIEFAVFFPGRQIDGLITAGLVRPRHAYAIQEYRRVHCYNEL